MSRARHFQADIPVAPAAPFFRNVGKRLTKSPKAYLRDTGLLHHLLNIGSLAELDAHPVRGASWETFVIEDMLRRERLARPFSQPFCWRTATCIGCPELPQMSPSAGCPKKRDRLRCLSERVTM